MAIKINDLKVAESKTYTDNVDSINNLQHLSEDELNVTGGFFKFFRKSKSKSKTKKYKFSFFR